MAWGPITVEGRIPLAGEKFINADQRTAAGNDFGGVGRPAVLPVVGQRRRLLDYLKAKNLDRYAELIKKLGIRK